MLSGISKFGSGTNTNISTRVKIPPVLRDGTKGQYVQKNSRVFLLLTTWTAVLHFVVDGISMITHVYVNLMFNLGQCVADICSEYYWHFPMEKTGKEHP